MCCAHSAGLAGPRLRAEISLRQLLASTDGSEFWAVQHWGWTGLDGVEPRVTGKSPGGDFSSDGVEAVCTWMVLSKSSTLPRQSFEGLDRVRTPSPHLPTPTAS